MQRENELTPLHGNVATLLHSIEDCLTKRRIIPCLILLYAGIDSMSALEDGRASRAAFKRWVERYVLNKASTLGCTASDLYAARCGILHTLSAESDMSRKGQARKIMYAWGIGMADRLARTTRIMTYECRVVHVRELIDAFRNGLADYLEEIHKDKQRQRRVLANADIWLTNMSTDVVEDFLNQYDSSPQPNETS